MTIEDRAWLRRLEYLVIAAFCVAVFVSCSPWMSPSDKSEVAGVDETIVGEDGGADAPSPSPTTSAPDEPSTGAVGGGTGVNAAAASAATGDDEQTTSRGEGSASASKDPTGSFGVDLGPVQTLYPSLRRTVAVTFSNPWKIDIEVRSVNVRVTVPASRAAACPATYVVVTPAAISTSTPVTVPARGTAASSFAVMLSGDAPDSCQGVPFGLVLNATGGKS